MNTSVKVMNTSVKMRRVGGPWLAPAEPKAAELLRQMPIGEDVVCRVLRGRSALQNRLYWQVLERVVATTGKWRDADELHAALKIATGHVETVRLFDGCRVLVPDSIRFEHMSQDEASGYYEAAYGVICDEVMGGISVDDLLDQFGLKEAA